MASTLKTLFPCLALVFLLFSSSEAKEYLVGGKGSSWKIPSSPDEYNKWAEKNRFKIGDYLVLDYDASNDSVLEVVEADYKSCNKGSPIKAFHDGKTKIELDRSGRFYFISGADGHCEKGQKLVVEVLSAEHGSFSHSPASAPYPSAPAPAPAPVSGVDHGSKLAFVGGTALMVGSLAFVLALV